MILSEASSSVSDHGCGRESRWLRRPLTFFSVDFTTLIPNLVAKSSEGREVQWMSGKPQNAAKATSIGLDLLNFWDFGPPPSPLSVPNPRTLPSFGQKLANPLLPLCADVIWDDRLREWDNDKGGWGPKMWKNCRSHFWMVPIYVPSNHNHSSKVRVWFAP